MLHGYNKGVLQVKLYSLNLSCNLYETKSKTQHGYPRLRIAVYGFRVRIKANMISLDKHL